MLQNTLIGLLVALCAVHVAWTLLLPATWRRRIARALLRWHWPVAIASRLERRARADLGGACGSCEHHHATPAAARPIRVVKRARR